MGSYCANKEEYDRSALGEYSLAGGHLSGNCERNDTAFILCSETVASRCSPESKLDLRGFKTSAYFKTDKGQSSVAGGPDTWHWLVHSRAFRPQGPKRPLLCSSAWPYRTGKRSQ